MERIEETIRPIPFLLKRQNVVAEDQEDRPLSVRDAFRKGREKVIPVITGPKKAFVKPSNNALPSADPLEWLRGPVHQEHMKRLEQSREKAIAATAPPPISEHVKAAAKGLCDALQNPRGRWARAKPPYVCSSPVSRDGKCKEHYLRDILRVSLTGKSPAFRPFRQHQVPLRDMTDRHHEVLRSLPIDTPYEACIAAMNDADGAVHLAPIAPRIKTKSKGWL